MDFFSSRMNGEYSEQELRRLAHACAVYAYYTISLCPEEETLSQFKAGDVQFSVASKESGAQKLWDSAKEEIADLLSFDDDALSFSGVRI